MLDDRAARPGDAERAAVLVGYGLFFLAVANGITALIGGVIAFLRRDAVRGTIWESHYRNMLTVFWAGLFFAALMLAAIFSGLFAMMGMAFAPGWQDGGWLFALPLLGGVGFLGALAGMVFGIWYLWRILRGFIRALDEKAY